MGNRISTIAAKATLQQFAQGASQNLLQHSIASFIAPPVNVATPTGYYKVYSEKSRFRVPNTRRNAGEAATKIGWNAQDKTYNCTPNALDCPIDILESMKDQAIESAFREAVGLVAETAALAYEAKVLDMAVASATKSTINLADDTNLISDFDDIVIDLIKATGLGGSLTVKMAFSAGAWVKFKNHKSVIDRLSDSATKVANLGNLKSLLAGEPEARCTYALRDNAPEGKKKDLGFIMENQVLIFVGTNNATRRDPSFMKTFRLDGEWMKTGTYQTPDGRAEVAKMDWSEDVQVTNADAALLVTLN